jgi:hypothetical protein
VVGAVSYVDRSCAIFEVVVKHQGESCSFVVSLEGDEKTEAYCTLESMERSQRLSPTPIVRQLAGALRTPWVSPMDLDLDPDQGPDGPAESEAETGEPPGEAEPAFTFRPSGGGPGSGGLAGEVAEDDATVRVVHRSPPPPPPVPASGIPDWQGGLPDDRPHDRPGNGNGARHSSANGNGSGGHA